MPAVAATLSLALAFVLTACPTESEPEPTVSAVTVSPAVATVEAGGILAFTAEVLGTNDPPQGVTWSMDRSGVNFGTSINSSGGLTVAAGETSTMLTIWATSTFQDRWGSRISGTATVTVSQPPPLTGAVTITGTPQVGQTLTADTTYLEGTGALSFQWWDSWSMIPGATNPTFAVQTTHVGHAIRVIVTRVGYSGYVASTPIRIPRISVAITGTPRLGHTLAASAVVHDGGSFPSFHWQRGTTNISGAHNSTYVVQAADVGYTISVRVTRGSGTSQISYTSAPTDIVPIPPSLTGTVTVTGTPRVGDTLMATTTLAGVTLQWERGTAQGWEPIRIGGTGTSLPLAAGPLYVVQNADVGRTLRVRVTRMNYFSYVASTPTAIVPTPTVTISGTARVGQTLTANITNWGGTGTFSSWWESSAGGVWRTISGATGSSYVVQAADVGHHIRVVVSLPGFTNFTSTQTAIVTN